MSDNTKSDGIVGLEAVPTRERCGVCHKISPVGFHVPNELWDAVVHPQFNNSILCLNCFISYADEKLARWDTVIKFYPVSLAAHLEVIERVRHGA